MTFGGPDVTRLRKTGELAGLELDGALPNAIREFEAAKMKRYYPKYDGKTPREILECVSWDIVGPFQTTSIGGARYSHDAVDCEGNLRFACLRGSYWWKPGSITLMKRSNSAGHGPVLMMNEEPRSRRRWSGPWRAQLVSQGGYARRTHHAAGFRF